MQLLYKGELFLVVNCFKCYFQDNRSNNNSFLKMNFIAGLLASIVVVQAAPYNGHYTYPAATTLVRVPEHDSAIVRSERFGGNFAYSIAQRHAYQVFAPNTVPLYNNNPFGYSHHQFSQFPFEVPSVPGHHYYIQHPFPAPVVPSFVSVVYPGGEQQPAEYPDEETTEPNVDSEQTENPDAEDVVIVGENADNDATREEATEENIDESNDTTDDSITVDAYRYGGVN